MCRAKKYLLIVLFNVCAFVCALHSSSSYAIDLSQDVTFIGSKQSVWFRTGSRNCRSGGNSCGWSNEDWSASVYTMYSNANTTTRLYDLYIEMPVNSVQAGDYIVQTLYVWQDGLSVSGHSFVQSIAYGGVNNVSVVDVDFESFSTNSGMITIISRANAAFTDSDLKFVGNPSGTGVLDLAGGYTSNGTTGPAYMRPGTASLWRPRTQVDNSTAINSINNQLPTITNNLNNMNNALDDINSGISDLQRSQEQANDDANDRYQDEKDTIQDNADNSVDSWEDAQQNLSFQAPTGLFSWFWSLGTTDQCINIPVLASLLHSTETTYCSWWSTEIRSIVSPIINIFLVCIVSGFIIKWLRSSGL